MVTITIRPHPFYTRDGHDIRLTLPITLKEAVLGAKVRVPTPDGPVMLSVPPGASSGKVLRLKGRGVPKLRGSGRGDLHVIVTVVIPEKLNKSERDLLRQLNEVAATAVLPKGGGPGLFDRLRDIFG